MAAAVIAGLVFLDRGEVDPSANSDPLVQRPDPGPEKPVPEPEPLKDHQEQAGKKDAPKENPDSKLAPADLVKKNPEIGPKPKPNSEKDSPPVKEDPNPKENVKPTPNPKKDTAPVKKEPKPEENPRSTTPADSEEVLQAFLADLHKQGSPRPTGQQIYEKTLKSTVWIVGFAGPGQVSGSGFLVNLQERLVVTNYHVVFVDGVALKDIVVIFPQYQEDKLISDPKHYLGQIRADKEKYRARVLGVEPTRDLALLKLDQLPEKICFISMPSLSKPSRQPMRGTAGAPW